MSALSRPAPSRTAGGQALILAAGMLAAATLARRWGARRATAGVRADAETRVSAAIRQRDNHVSRVAHELKTPMTVLKGHVQLLARSLNSVDGAEPERVRVTIAAIETAVTDAAARLDQMAEQTNKLLARQTTQLAQEPYLHPLVPLDGPEMSPRPPTAMGATDYAPSANEPPADPLSSAIDPATAARLRLVRTSER